MEAVLLQLLNGLDKGGAYALIALGLTLVFGTLGVVNFSHGALFMLGVFCAVNCSPSPKQNGGRFHAPLYGLVSLLRRRQKSRARRERFRGVFFRLIFSVLMWRARCCWQGSICR